ncbi:hypothetical protein D9V73_02740 [Buchnera aphidicola (Melaphis rhois)]|uniref:Uncharacterized protein n=1 Tax=Buchnera aphidicola subsp. Melaphis rhois TaxID=118103 RepID=A0A4D6Y3I5_BUCMH|nr:hypothetical protein D9V73_02740 [Buchnera aphidicola (Melaphis rhois)]
MLYNTFCIFIILINFTLFYPLLISSNKLTNKTQYENTMYKLNDTIINVSHNNYFNKNTSKIFFIKTMIT